METEKSKKKYKRKKVQRNTTYKTDVQFYENGMIEKQKAPHLQMRMTEKDQKPSQQRMQLQKWQENRAKKTNSLQRNYFLIAEQVV
jgi:hypothetical protein